MVKTIGWKIMALIKWTSELETGLTIIDAQHKKLVDMINSIGELSSDESAFERDSIVEANIMKLIEYTNYHFQTEEDLLAECSYEESEQHKDSHNCLRFGVAEIYAKFAKQNDVAEQLHGFLSRWLQEHILGADMRYVSAIKKCRPDLIRD
jgi:hemerythrin